MFRRTATFRALAPTAALLYHAQAGGGRTGPARDVPAYMQGDPFLVNEFESGIGHDSTSMSLLSSGKLTGVGVGGGDAASSSGGAGGGKKLHHLHQSQNSLSAGANMFADTATGLGNAAMTQMSPDDVLARMEQALDWYSPAVYAWLMLPSVDLIDTMMLENIVPKDQPQTHLARWFVAPEEVVHSPRTLRHLLGDVRFEIVTPAFEKVLGDYEAVSPLLRVLSSKEGGGAALPTKIWVPLARWMAVMASNPEMKDAILSLTLAIANGHGPSTLALPAMQQQRGTLVGELLIGAGAEYGVVSLAQLGVDLLLINGSQCNFSHQKMLTLAFHRTSARMMDWSVRCSGELHRCLPRWYAGHIGGNVLPEMVKLAEKNPSSFVALSAMAQQQQQQQQQQQEEQTSSAAATAAGSVELAGVDDLTADEQQQRQDDAAIDADNTVFKKLAGGQARRAALSKQSAYLDEDPATTAAAGEEDDDAMLDDAADVAAGAAASVPRDVDVDDGTGPTFKYFKTKPDDRRQYAGLRAKLVNQSLTRTAEVRKAQERRSSAAATGGSGSLRHANFGKKGQRASLAMKQIRTLVGPNAVVTRDAATGKLVFPEAGVPGRRPLKPESIAKREKDRQARDEKNAERNAKAAVPHAEKAAKPPQAAPKKIGRPPSKKSKVVSSRAKAELF